MSTVIALSDFVLIFGGYLVKMVWCVL